MTKVAILGAGQIGRAVYKILSTIHKDIDSFVIDSNRNSISILGTGTHRVINLNDIDVPDLAKFLFDQRVTHVISALPFFLNEKAALASYTSNCHYIDFTEDDIMADRVQEIFKKSKLHCAVKCGLAPGFINYIGHNLITKIESPKSLLISVGALPRMVSYSPNQPELSYNLTWSIDGLVNEYIRPCRIRRNGNIEEVPPLTGQIKVVLDGTEYEAAYTSGGVGSLIHELKSVPNVCYMTLRYPGHYRYVREVIQDKFNNFEEIKKVFQDKFPTTDDDVIVVYAEVLGHDRGQLTKTSYYNKFYGVDGLTGIQATTAGSGVAILELMLSGKISGIINHADIKLEDFISTKSSSKYYKISR